jgi:type II secretory pathway pseudopilin PulG
MKGELGMKAAVVIRVVAATAVVAGLAFSAGTGLAKDKQTSKGMAAVEHAAKAKKYLFIFFHSGDSEQTASMRETFNAAVDKVSKKAQRVEIDVTDATETAVIDKYGVRGAPMPLVLAVAPNGAVTGGFPAPFAEEQILSALASPVLERSLKALQEQKAVLLCLQNGHTALNDAAMKGVNDLRADPAYSSAVEVIVLDPSDAAEAKLLSMLKVDPKTAQAITVCLVPPGRAVATLSGATTKEMIAGSLKGGGGGCCPAGSAKSCGPAPATSQGTKQSGAGR